MSAVSTDWVGFRRLPSGQRTAMVGLILIQAFSLQLLIEPANFPVTVVALAGWFAPQFRLLFNLRLFTSFLAIISIYVVRCRIMEHDYSVMGFIGTEVAYELSCCTLVMQLLVLFMKKYEHRLPVWLLAISGAGMVLTGDVRLTPDSRTTVMFVSTAYLVCWIAFAAASRDPVLTPVRRGRWIRRIVTMCMLITALALGQQLSIFFHRHESQLERAISDLLFSKERFEQRHGFSGGGGLFDVSLSKRGGKGIALRIQSTSKPTYLRGCAFDLFHENLWMATGEFKVITPSPVPPSLHPVAPQSKFFWTQDRHSAMSQSFLVSPGERLPDVHMFTPLGTAAVSCDSSSVNVLSNQTIERLAHDGRQNYELFVTDDRHVSPEKIDPRYLQLPFDLGPYVKDLATALAAERATSTEKIDAVATFFRTQFDYSLEIHLPRTADRLTHFLTNRVPGHCEYFATATTLLLRLQGIPARYVTGFIVTGKNEITGEWIARQRDAHAWVEAYNADLERWVIVESTPENGVPMEEPQYYMDSLQEALINEWNQWLQLLTAADFWEHNLNLLRAFAPTIVTFFLGALTLYILYRSFFPGLLETYRATPLARERIHLDRFLARKGTARQRSESLLQFAQRLEQEKSLTTSLQMAEWYREYAELRFSGRVVPDETIISAMRRKRRELAQKTKVLV